MDSNTPKKRGRKPKLKNIEVNKVPKKRGRKPKNIIKTIDETNHTLLNNINNNWENNENLILHLKITESNKEELNIEPVAYDNNDSFSTVNDLLEVKQVENNTNNNYFQKNTKVECNNEIKSKQFLKKYNETYITKKEYDTFINFVYSNDKIWPIQTDIHCLNCVHKFNNIPCGIPIKYLNNKFYLKGCFCSFNCAAKYIFDKNEYNKWEHYSLLNLLYNKIYNKNEYIPLAPDREILKIFGGTLEIDEYRKLFNNLNTDYKINLPPLIAVVPKIEETKITNNNYSKINYNLFNNIEDNSVNGYSNSFLNNSMELKIKKSIC